MVDQMIENLEDMKKRAENGELWFWLKWLHDMDDHRFKDPNAIDTTGATTQSPFTNPTVKPATSTIQSSSQNSVLPASTSSSVWGAAGPGAGPMNQQHGFHVGNNGPSSNLSFESKDTKLSHGDQAVAVQGATVQSTTESSPVGPFEVVRSDLLAKTTEALSMSKSRWHKDEAPSDLLLSTGKIQKAAERLVQLSFDSAKKKG